MLPGLARRLLVLALLAPGPGAAAAPAVPLPPPHREGRLGVEAALASRRSVRAFTAEPLTLAEVGQLLWAAQGVTGPEGQRAAPSARRQYPLEIAVVAQHVDGLPPGAYRYLPARHALEPLASAKQGERLLTRATDQEQVHAAPAVFVVAAVYERMDAGPRARTWSDWEAGAATENLLLQAVALRLGAVVVGGMEPAAVRKALHLSEREQVIVLVPVGHPAP
ncbi:SagB/ThcOx family dehydrogenase [Anaeromyxobacter sp. PSR-1]|uniref:SagB/ThcOx family dehydrogenase n=1 Tax=Anaeromyxobacter sp. PSR-1 TaxID=1300915 RepID=UPI0005E4C9FB|nr:SagB/ThcOx family dehydrogenase [Anaeromyxobacter sp. PSR-1]GAO02164.1 putative nitroreductase [Anaeromyxobacter sp. PSR-1]